MLNWFKCIAVALAVSSGVAMLQSGETPTLAPQPGQRPVLPTQTAKTNEHVSLASIFKNEAERKAMGLDKLTPDEQHRLAQRIVAFAAPMREGETRASLLRGEAVRYLTAQGWEEDPTRKMQGEGWNEVEVVGTATIKGDKYSVDREVLAVKVFGSKRYYGSRFRDDLSSFDRRNLRSGTMWGKDMLRTLTLIGIDGAEIELRQVDVEILP